MGQPVVHWEIAANDAAKIQSFYSSLFNWKVDTGGPMNYGMVSTADSGVGGGIYKPTDPKTPRLTFYVQVDDLQAYQDKAVKLGGKALVPPTPIPGIGSFAMFADPEGTVIGLFKPN